MAAAPTPADPLGDGKSNARLVEVLQRYEPYLLNLARQRFPKDCAGRFGVSDVVQETFLRAHEHFDQFRGQTEADFRSWLAAVLINTLHKMRQHQQAQKRGAGLEISLEAKSNLLAVLHQTTPSAEVSRQEQNERMRQAIEQLPEDYRKVVKLRNLELLSFREIGEQMNRSEDAAQHLWCRAIQQLKLLLKTDA